MKPATPEISPELICAPELEEAVLGTILLEHSSIIFAQDIITINVFHSAVNREIYQSILNVQERRESIDILQVTDDLRLRKKLKFVGGPGYIAKLTNQVASSAHIEQHCFILLEKQINREHLALADRIKHHVLTSESDALDNIEWLSDQAYTIASLTDIRRARSNKEIIREIEIQLDNAKKEKGMTGISSGFRSLDQLYGGYQKGTLVIKAARPAMGKTAHAINEALHMAVYEKQKILFFSLEMSDTELMKRIISIHTEIELNKFKTGNIAEDEWIRYHNKVSDLLTDNMVIIDNCTNIKEIRNKCKRERLTSEIGAIFIDYLQIVEGFDSPGFREQEIAFISRQCKLLAKSMNCPVIAMSQLSRKVEERGNKKPQLSDLRESGAIEQDADIVQFLYRPEYYDIREDDNGEPTDGVAWILTAKHRNGGLDDKKMKWEPEFTRFIDWEAAFSGFSPIIRKSENHSSISREIAPEHDDEDDVPF